MNDREFFHFGMGVIIGLTIGLMAIICISTLPGH
jgi:hypothetical protein